MLLELSFERAQTIAKTLPSLLTRALQTVTGNASSRFVLTLDRWTVEQSNDGTNLLLILARMTDTKCVSTFPARRAKAWALSSVVTRWLFLET